MTPSSANVELQLRPRRASHMLAKEFAMTTNPTVTTTPGAVTSLSGSTMAKMW